MKFPQTFIDEVRAAADIVTVISDSVSQRKAGTSYKGLCPFHGEKTPSFNVNRDRGFFHCFGCGVGVWRKANEVVAMIESARQRGVDVTADIYPYLAWSSNLKVLVPDKQWTTPASVKEALDDVGRGRNVQITRLPK